MHQFFSQHCKKIKRWLYQIVMVSCWFMLLMLYLPIYICGLNQFWLIFSFFVVVFFVLTLFFFDEKMTFCLRQILRFAFAPNKYLDLQKKNSCTINEKGNHVRVEISVEMCSFRLKLASTKVSFVFIFTTSGCLFVDR